MDCLQITAWEAEVAGVLPQQSRHSIESSKEKRKPFRMPMSPGSGHAYKACSQELGHSQSYYCFWLLPCSRVEDSLSSKILLANAAFDHHTHVLLCTMRLEQLLEGAVKCWYAGNCILLSHNALDQRDLTRDPSGVLPTKFQGSVGHQIYSPHYTVQQVNSLLMA